MKVEEIIEELVSVILMQEEEINKLRKKVERIKQYIEVYEDYIEGAENSKWRQ